MADETNETTKCCLKRSKETETVEVDPKKTKNDNETNSLDSEKLTRAVAIDCEFVGTGIFGVDNMLARVSIVNENGVVLLDYYVKPTKEVINYRTPVSGITPGHLSSDSAKEFAIVRQEVTDIIKDRIVIGHDLTNDWQVLNLSHPKHLIRDTSEYVPFRRVSNGRRPGLRKLASALLRINIQNGEHDSIIDARTTMRLYKRAEAEWEKMY